MKNSLPKDSKKEKDKLRINLCISKFEIQTNYYDHANSMTEKKSPLIEIKQINLMFIF